MGSDLPVPRKRAIGRTPPWRRNPVLMARLPEVQRLASQGLSNVEIGKVLGVDEGTVRNDKDKLDELYRERLGGDIERIRAGIVRELDIVRDLALQQATMDALFEQAVLFGLEIELNGQTLRVRRDDKGTASFKSSKASSLDVARKAMMDKAKVQGIIVDKVASTDSDGNTMSLAALLQLTLVKRVG